MRKSLLLLFSLFFLAGGLLAQRRVVSGTVLDAKGNPVYAASVTFKGYNKGTSTGPDGTFTVSIPTTVKTMVISGVGIVTQEIDIQGKTTLGTINLKNANKEIEEVVITGYGQTKKTNVTGSITTVGGAQIADKPFTSVDKTLQGAVAGVEVSSTSGAPGSSTDIRIRGIGSINASASPLWVIDGVEANTGDYSMNTTTSNIMATLNPDDIESVTVLKDAASTAIYGSKAGNGVILVTTKKGRAGRTRVNFSTEIGQNSQAYNPSNKPMNSPQYQTILRQAIINAGYATDTATADGVIVNDLGYPSDWTTINTNWRDVVQQKGNQSQYNLSVTGGTDKTQVYFSGGYFNQIGTAIASDFKRYNGTISVTQKATDRLTFSGNMMVGSSLQHTPFNTGDYGNPILESFLLLPWYTPRLPNGDFRFGANDPLNEFPLAPSPFNPLPEAAYNFNTYRQTSVRGYAEGEYKILNNLSFTSRYSGEYTDISEDQYWNPFYGDGYSTVTASAGNAFSVYSRIYDWTWSNFFDYRQNLNRDKTIYLDFKPGYEAYEFNEYNLQAGAKGLPQNLDLKYLASATTPTQTTVVPTASATASEFALADINFKDKYVISGSFRRDGSSVFGSEHKYGNFYSVGGTWNLDEENFMKNMKTINMLKLRSSYGATGNQLGFGLYTPLATYSYGYNYAGNGGSAPNNVGNPNLTWEKNNIFNVGVDFGLFGDRATGTVEYYNRKTSNLLLGVPLSLTSGFTTQNENVGSMSNKGIEVTLGGKPIVTRDFTWSVNFNIAHNINRITGLYQNNPVPSANYYFQYTVGHDFQTYYLPQWAGANPQTGQPQWYTDNTSKRTLTSNVDSANFVLNDKYTATPKIFGSFTNTFSYKGFSLDVQFNYNFGNYLFDTWGFITNSEGGYIGGLNQMTRELGAWQKPGDKTDIPQIIYGGNDNSNNLSTRWLYKGDYIRLRNVQLSYAIPKSLLDKIHISNLSVYVRGTNLLTFATDKNLPYDPESGAASSLNFDVFMPKTIAGGLKLGF